MIKKVTSNPGVRRTLKGYISVVTFLVSMLLLVGWTWKFWKAAPPPKTPDETEEIICDIGGEKCKVKKGSGQTTCWKHRDKDQAKADKKHKEGRKGEDKVKPDPEPKPKVKKDK